MLSQVLVVAVVEAGAWQNRGHMAKLLVGRVFFSKKYFWTKIVRVCRSDIGVHI